jgi:hypothetical protein
MTKDEICGLLRQIHDVLAMQSETNHWAQPTPAEYAMGYAEGFNDGCKPKPEQEPAAYDKTEMNGFVQDLYDKKMQEGKHGHYETMFHVVHRAIEAAHGIKE